ncbi:MAG: hypothetical protein ABSF47_03755 [Minisyncoccia bacterium]|jgi:hypothetical protein
MNGENELFDPSLGDDSESWDHLTVDYLPFEAGNFSNSLLVGTHGYLPPLRILSFGIIQKRWITYYSNSREGWGGGQYA